MSDDAEMYAKLVESMMDMTLWKHKADARCALAIAARAIRRGRHLTDREKTMNLADAMNCEFPLFAESLRRSVAGH